MAYLFRSVVGNVVFDEHLSILEGSAGSVIQEIPAHLVPKALKALKDPRFFSLFRKANIELTKADIRTAVTEDVLIVQAVHMLDELHRAMNMLSTQFREWYGYYNPEFSWQQTDNSKFIDCVASGAAPKALDSMGGNLSKKDAVFLQEMSIKLGQLNSLKADLEEYLDGLMGRVCPNVAAITGFLIGAKLLEKAGSLRRLSELSSQTVQVLGAEKALFRHLRNKRMLPPKYGLLHEHPLIMKAPKAEHGKRARFLADKIAIASKVDYFKGPFIGDRITNELHQRFP